MGFIGYSDLALRPHRSAGRYAGLPVECDPTGLRDPSAVSAELLVHRRRVSICDLDQSAYPRRFGPQKVVKWWSYESHSLSTSAGISALAPFGYLFAARRGSRGCSRVKLSGEALARGHDPGHHQLPSVPSTLVDSPTDGCYPSRPAIRAACVAHFHAPPQLGFPPRFIRHRVVRHFLRRPVSCTHTFARLDSVAQSMG